MNNSFPVHVDAQTIQCHEGNSIDDNELVAPENFKDCDDGIKQCKVSGSKLTTYPSVLDFWKIKLEKSSLTNWISSQFQTGFLLPV